MIKNVAKLLFNDYRIITEIIASLSAVFIETYTNQSKTADEKIVKNNFSEFFGIL